ncbi:hypothetical protein RRF57_001464 [Xylaria bambusicola]|uniref:2EXR domain-containing protein n=1 Tax=Xylaria bambusicola TaxID=326684 RepID=A0AAN7Z3J1_9PEZI
MVCQTRSKVRQQAEKCDIRQTRQKGKRQQNTDTTPDVVYLRTVRVAAGSPNRRAPKRASKQAVKRTKKRRSQAPRVPTSFNHLPTEIRLMIWEEYVRTPRIIRIDVLSESPTKAEQGYTCQFRWDEYQGKSEQVCPLVGVNRESRYVALHALKESLIHFTMSVTIEKPKRFQAAVSIRRTFSIRSHDVVFFDNSGSPILKRVWFNGSSSRVANIMVDLDVSDINYKSYDAIPRWRKMFAMARDLTTYLGNGEHLQSIYCLMQDRTHPASDKTLPYTIDYVQELTPERSNRFPRERRGDLLQWLQEFDIYPHTIDEPFQATFYLGEDDAAVRAAWKNVIFAVERIEGVKTSRR